MSRPTLPLSLLATLHDPRDHYRHAVRLVVFVALYLLSAIAAIALHAWAGLGGWAWIAAAPLYLLAAASLHGISLFTHEAVHDTLLSHRTANRIGGALCAIPVLQNFSAYQVLHLRHHDHLGDAGDPDHYKNYTRWSWLVFAMNWGRLIIGYPAYIVAIPILGWRHGTRRDRIWIAAEVAAVVAFVVAIFQLPFPVLLHGWLMPMLLINTMVNIRGMSQHTLLEDANDPVRGTRSILTNRLVAFFMCNENYHLEHHLYPGVPWYHLPRLHAQMRQDLIDRGAPYIPSYVRFVRDFIAGSLQRSPLGRH